VYLHSRDSARRSRDTNFQGFGRFTTGSTGEYYFRTIKPVPYPGRTPHIHVRVKKGGRELLTTQLFVNGHPQNKTDGVLAGLPVRDCLSSTFTVPSGLPRRRPRDAGRVAATGRQGFGGCFLRAAPCWQRSRG